ncbi:MAG: VCBS domain-containing protein [Bacteroidales bacterium]|nr:VCBS domain-containing protein [Bacteroidales bacterium]
MKKTFFAAIAALILPATVLSAQEYKWYGFIRNYVTYDSHEGKSGTEDFFYYLPYDNPNYGAADDTDPYAISTLRFASLTSRLGLDVTGYKIEDWTIGAKIEADFYSGVSGVTGTAQFRLRQAYMTMAKNDWSIKIGQAWHPMAADMPDVISLNTGAPFGPFSRTPLASADVKLSDALTLTGAAVWQMQYTSCGPNGSSADYMRFGMTPEIYLGLSYKQGGFLGRIGADVLSIKPRAYNTAKGVYSAGAVKVNDRITTPIFFAYAQYTKDLFSIKAKTAFAQGGDHLCLNGGYGVSAINTDGSWEYSATSNSSTWVSLKYGKKVQGVLFGGYVKNFGTKDEVSALYFSKNSYSNMTQMYRISPAVLYNLGKVQFGLEYELTGVEYGTKLVKGLATENLHWVANNRLQLMAKYTF